MRYALLIPLSLWFFSSLAGSDPSYSDPSWEITFHKRAQLPDVAYQRTLRQHSAWQQFLSQHGTWYVHFNESNGMPHRAYGKPISVQGLDPVEKALNFIADHLAMFPIPTNDLVHTGTGSTGKNTFINFKQQYNGIDLLGSRLTIKLDSQGRVIMWGADVFNEIETEGFTELSPEQAIILAGEGLPHTFSDPSDEPVLRLLHIPDGRESSFRMVYELTLEGTLGNIPAKFYTLVDAIDGKVWYRQNKVVHFHADHKPCSTATCDRQPRIMGLPLQVGGSVNGLIQPSNPFEDSETRPLPFLKVTVNGNNYFTNANGVFNIPANGPVNGQFRLEGNWCSVRTNGNVPQFSTSLAEGNGNSISFNNAANIRERSAYYSTSVIHEHMKSWLPSFTGMDFALPTNVDVAGECNAFYDGASINFYNLAGGCNATSLVSDVVYHEYGHGINDKFYQSQGAFFANGAMNEGYADFWALSRTDSPLLGVGFYTTNTDPLRRYDTDRKVYPIDLVGEVHSDGEIICGAWWDTHLLMGADWNLTSSLFIDAFPGLQATEFNGNEGVAYTDVLIDVLQADDNDGDITNGTPNGSAIIEGFYLHGITLISNAELFHNDVEFANAGEPIQLDGEIVLNFPFTQYLDKATVFYQINNENTWNEAEMAIVNDEYLTVDLPAQPAGTIIAYYLGAEDINGSLSNVLPIGAEMNDANLPFYILVGYNLAGFHDCDVNEDFGNWTLGAADDNATTGEWELELPVGSFTDPNDISTVVAPYYQHTPGPDGELCYVTGNSSSPIAGIGENDVDAGKTTLVSPSIDISQYENPCITYWRWYTNSPSTGANPGADWWEVLISDDGGQSWVHVEETKTSDQSWRRKAFRVADYADITGDIRMRFIASDSTRPGQYLDGGSLVEAALDDFAIYELTTPNDISESIESDEGLLLWPNPAVSSLIATISLDEPAMVTLSVFDVNGKLCHSESKVQINSSNQQISLDLSKLSPGLYSVEVALEGRQKIRGRVIKQ